MAKKITLDDIARETGLSKYAVSVQFLGNLALAQQRGNVFCKCAKT